METSGQCELAGQVVFPGDKVYDLPPTGIVRIGRGLEQDGTSIKALRAGVLQQDPNGKLWILSKHKRYIPQMNDAVIGMITRRGGENHEVDIGGLSPAILPSLAFEGVTRRNRPNLKEGDLVYARVDSANRDMQPTLTCMDTVGKASCYGPLKDGYLFTSECTYARSLMAQQPPPAVLAALGKSFEFELAVGANGRVWVNASNSADIIAISLAIQQAEGRTEGQIRSIVAALSKGAAAGKGAP